MAAVSCAAPEAEPDDGWLDVYIVRKVGRLTIAKLLGMYKNGRHFVNGQLTEAASRTLFTAGPGRCLCAPSMAAGLSLPRRTASAPPGAVTVQCFSRTMKIIPLADRVVIKTVEVEETTKGGLILTGSAKEKPQVAEVIAVGPGGVVDGKEVKMTVKVGDKVLTSKYSGTEVKVDGEECTIVRQATSWQSWD